MKISVITLGCKVNQVESEKIAEKLESYGFDVSMGLGLSDIYLINTCAVTNEAERKSRNIISKILKINQNAKIYVCGCSSENDPEKFKKGDFVKKVIGTKDKLSIADIIDAENKNSKKSDILGQTHRVSNRTRADLFVQNGCNNFCSYCIIPYLRGREVSFPLDEIKDEIKLLEPVTKEIVITGINLSAYGKDIPGSEGLIEVARLFRGSPSRFRFSSLEVGVITEKFLSELKTFDNFCDHFHLSLQSGSDDTLKQMNRKYTASEYEQKVKLIRKFFPNAGITTDIIVGFPTETDQNFEETLNFAKKIAFSDIHIFPYSRRSGTLATKLKCVAKNVPERVKKLTLLAEEMKKNFIQKNLGKTFEVIIENQKEGYFLAHTKNYILCYIKSSENLSSNSVFSVKLTALYGEGALAEIIK